MIYQCRKKAVEIFKKDMDRRKDGWTEANAKYDLMDGLMRLKDEEGKQLRDVEVLDNIVSLVLAGYESTSLSIMWAVYYLAKYPNVLKKLQARLSNSTFSIFLNFIVFSP